MSEIEFDVELSDGRIAHCWRAQSQSYADCEFSSGLVTGIEPDTFYLRFERQVEEPLMLFLRPDELMAVLWIGNGALWSSAMMQNARKNGKKIREIERLREALLDTRRSAIHLVNKALAGEKEDGKNN